LHLFDTNWLSQLEIAIRVVIAGTLGGLVGLERELANRPAGLRTHAILAATAALLVGLADPIVTKFAAETSPGLLRTDPLRIVQAVITGVAFLGAGTIFRHSSENVIEGLTTGTTLLLVAAVGIAVAMQQLLLAGLVTLVTLAALRILRRFKGKRD
jgi:putative Mg2+ transporter-C (MgtC) family protein